MLGTLGNTRKIEVIPSYARKNKSAHGLPRHYLQKSLKSSVISRFFKLEGGATTPLLHQ
mgnify:FL=1